MSPPYTQNPDRVTPPVLSGGSAGLVVAVAVRSVIDRYVDPAERELWWNVAQAVLFLLPLVGAWVGARFKARNDVTPVRPGDTPRDQQGNALAPVSHTPSTGYPPPERLATPEERPRPRFDGP
jgi:hypothetical protein